MPSSQHEAKAAVRQHLRDQFARLSAAERANGSAQLCNRLAQQTAWQNARVILCFAPLTDEPDIFPLLAAALAAGKTAALPRFSPDAGAYVAAEIRDPGRDLSLGRFDILEPREICPVLPLNRLDLILVPAVAFDLCGRRLGRGKGFYDRLLTQVTGIRCGVAFDFQIVPEVPIEPHDVRVDCVVTPTRWLAIAGQTPA